MCFPAAADRRISTARGPPRAACPRSRSPPSLRAWTATSGWGPSGAWPVSTAVSFESSTDALGQHEGRPHFGEFAVLLRDMFQERDVAHPALRIGGEVAELAVGPDKDPPLGIDRQGTDATTVGDRDQPPRDAVGSLRMLEWADGTDVSQRLGAHDEGARELRGRLIALQCGVGGLPKRRIALQWAVRSRRRRLIAVQWAVRESRGGAIAVQ